MAIFRLRVNIISRARGQSVIAAAAYRAGEKLLDPNRAKDHDYTRKGGVEHTQIMAPATAPAWLQVTPGNKQQEHTARQELWRRAEVCETRKNSQLAREIVLALPHELTRKQRIDLVCDYVERNFTSRGMVADVALHAPRPGGDAKNFHAHILLTMRDLSLDGFARHKRRDWNGKELLQGWREDWAMTANRHLERAGRSERIDHRSNEERGIARTPQPKLGPFAHLMEKAGRLSDIGNDSRQIRIDDVMRDVARAGMELVNEFDCKLDYAVSPLARQHLVERMERVLDYLDHSGRHWGQVAGLHADWMREDLAYAMTPQAAMRAMEQAERMLDSIVPAPSTRDELDRADPGDSELHAAHRGSRGLSRAADSALTVTAGILSFFEPAPSPKHREPESIDDRIARLEAMRERLLYHAFQRAQATAREQEVRREEENERGRQRERDRFE